MKKQNTSFVNTLCFFIFQLKKIHLCWILLFGLVLYAQGQTILYVDIDATGSNTGTSWTDAYTDLQDALSLSNNNSSTNFQVWVAEGYYLPTVGFNLGGSGGGLGRDKTFYIKKNIEIYGGFSGIESQLSERDWITHTTTLSGDIGVPNDISDNSYNVVFIDGTTGNPITIATILDGFHIEKGYANTALPFSFFGGGIYNNGQGSGNVCSPSILNCSFSNNTAAGGGAISNNGRDNGVCSPQFTNCSFSNNNGFFSANAIYNDGGGNGICSPQFTNCSFSNTLSINGGLKITNFQTNNVLIENCIFWGNNPNNLVEVEEDNSIGTTLNYSIIQDGNPDGNVVLPPNITGSNNLDSNPLFLDAANNDLRLQPNSPAINVGNNSATGLIGITTDLAGNSRIVNSTVDIGTYENTCPLLGGGIHVKPNGGNIEDGSSWASPFTTLQDAIDLACKCPVREIWVAQGTYYPTVGFDMDSTGVIEAQEQAFYINKDIQIYGGFSGTEIQRSERDWITHTTTLSGDIGIPSENSDNSFHVLFLDGTTNPITNTTVLDGFKIENGNANGTTFPHRRGAGIYNKGDGSGSICSPSILNCSFSNNIAASSGGAIYNFGSSGTSSPLIMNCDFSNNTSNFGGAICNSGSNGGISNPPITNCSFSDNMATNSGGAICSSGSSSGISNPPITNCSFSNNTGNNFGGAIYNFGTNGTCSPPITNCSFSNNTAGNGGGAIRNVQTDNILLENSIFWDNSSTNGEDEISEDGANGTTLNYGIIDDGTPDGNITLPPNITGSNNLDSDPLFVDAANDDLRLQANSPAIDVGNTSATGLVGITSDLDGNTRILNGTVDKGAYESNFILACSDSFTDGIGDYDNDMNNSYTICSGTSDDVALNFTSFSMESCCDEMKIYNSNNSTNLIGTYTGSNSPGLVRSSNGSNCLTIVVTTNSTITDSGWEAEVICCDLVCYEDMDGDGFGDSASSSLGCGTCNTGFVEDNTDCNDDDPTDTDVVINDNPIVQGDYIYNNSITSTGTMNVGGGRVNFQAGTEVVLGVNFVSAEGSDLWIRISNDCSVPPLPFVQPEQENVVEFFEEKNIENVEEKNIPQKAQLALSPNPTQVETTIAFSVPENGWTNLAIYNNTGTLVQQLVENNRLEKGNYNKLVSTSSFSEGIYFVVLQTEQEVITRKLIIIE